MAGWSLGSVPERRARLWANTRRMSEGLRSAGLSAGLGETPIIPVVVGGLPRTLKIWRFLFDAGVFVHPVVPPAVPPNECKIRLSMTAEHTFEQIDRVVAAFAEAVKHVPA